MTDEAADADFAPRDGDERTERAVQAMECIGLKRDMVMYSLKSLYKDRAASNNEVSSLNSLNTLYNIVLGSSCEVAHLHYALH